jgi:rare lipoprotein A
MNDDTERPHETRAPQRLRALAGPYRTRYWATGALTLALAVALMLSVAGAFDDETETSARGTGRAGIVAADSAAAPADTAAVRTDTTASAPEGAAGRATRGGMATETDNTRVEGAAGEVVGRGTASYYGAGLEGNPTASGEPFDPTELTAAHRTLPLGSRVRVTNLRSDETVTVRINDRGPFHAGRILDLSRRAAERIGMVARGKTRVEIELLEGEEVRK